MKAGDQAWVVFNNFGSPVMRYVTLLSCGPLRARTSVGDFNNVRVEEPERKLLSNREGARTHERVSAIHGISGELNDGQLVVTLARSSGSRWRNSNDGIFPVADIYLHTFADIPDDEAELSVARDAFLGGDVEHARGLAAKTLPFSSDLFMMLLAAEQTHLALCARDP